MLSGLWNIALLYMTRALTDLSPLSFLLSYAATSHDTKQCLEDQ